MNFFIFKITGMCKSCNKWNKKKYINLITPDYLLKISGEEKSESSDKKEIMCFANWAWVVGAYLPDNCSQKTAASHSRCGPNKTKHRVLRSTIRAHAEQQKQGRELCHQRNL